MTFAKKSLGQNFLSNQAIIKKMVSKIAISRTDTIVEIGPGRGALTKEILKYQPRKLILIEKDDFLASQMTEELGKNQHETEVIVINDDVLKCQPPSEPYKLTGNLPFYISGAIVKHFLDNEHKPSLMSILLQKEVAERIVKKDQKNSILATAVETYGDSSWIGVVKSGSFNPAPKVDGAVILVTNIKNPFKNKAEQQYWFNFVRTAFGQKRKTLVNNLKGQYKTDMVLKIMNNLDIKPDIRAEDLSYSQLYTIFTQLN